MPALVGGAAYTAAEVAWAWINVAMVVGSVAYSRQQQKKQKNSLKRLSNISAEADERTLSKLDPQAPCRLVYGEARVGGTIVFRHVNGAGQKYRHLLIVLADHECEQISNLQFDDELVPINAGGEATGRFAGHVQAHFFLGSEAQTSIAPLLANCPEVWTSAHRLRGRAGVYVRLTANTDLFPAGIPNITALVKGKKVYDPRSDLTAWTDNAALCIADYLTDKKLGLGFDYYTRINENELIASANVCDEMISVPN